MSNDANVVEKAIANIAATSEALEKYCNDPKNYNSYASHLLEHMCWELHKQANDLREISYRYGV
jgi:uncharacterized protein YeaO (DUF488 family)